MLGLTTLISGSAQAAPVIEYKALNLPGVWKTNKLPEARVHALRVADLDAARQLMERIYCMRLTADTTVFDLRLTDDQIEAELSQIMKGVKTTSEPDYKEDGSVFVTRSVKVRQVLETITKVVQQHRTSSGPVTLQTLTKSATTNIDTVIDATGAGALPGSKGMIRIQARRAAQLDGYRRLAERVLGMQLDDKTKVYNAILESDHLRARVNQMIRGAQETKVVFLDDLSCEVTMRMRVAEIYEVVRRYAKTQPNPQELTKNELLFKNQEYEEVGYGGPRKKADDRPQVPSVTEEIITISTKLIAEEIVVQ